MFVVSTKIFVDERRQVPLALRGRDSRGGYPYMSNGGLILLAWTSRLVCPQ